MTRPMQFTFKPIGIIHSCYPDKFGVPRQPGLVSAAEGRLELFPPYNRAEAVRGLEAFSHLWISFVFHHCLEGNDRLMVRPPRLGGNRKVGVFASRSTHRPNPLGLSVVKLEAVEQVGTGVSLRLSGLDLVDQTPVLDIKPYLPYSDAIMDARSGYVDQEMFKLLQVEFASEAEAQCARFEGAHPGLRRLIDQVVAQDPRPAYLARGDADGSSERGFVLRLYHYEIRWRIEATGDGVLARVLEIAPES